MSVKDFDKQFFIQSWGEVGYYENFSYGVGIDKVCEVCVYPFLSIDKDVLEIGSGGGVFTKRIKMRSGSLAAIDVIPKPEVFNEYMPSLKYIELSNQDYFCSGVPYNSIDLAFCYWEVISPDMISEHRDIIVHLKKI